MKTENLIVELLCEELPPKALKKLGAHFSQLLTEQLASLGLVDKNAVVASYASPRRLGVHIKEVLHQALDQYVVQKIMPAAVALQDGKPTAVLLKKLHALGLDEASISMLKKEHDGKNEVLVYYSTQAGVTLKEGLQLALEYAINKLPIPKVMTYQLDDGFTDVRFVRPAHRLLVLHGDKIVPVTVLDLEASNQTEGHRFEAKECPITIAHADDYEVILRERGHMIASFEKRLVEIKHQLETAAEKAGANLHPIEDAALLEEVCALVENPNVLTCQFEKEFLDVPHECLILTMKANQKYFPLLEKSGKLTHLFLVVSNLTPNDAALIIDGNEKVVRPRLADAKFFYDQDRKIPLASRVEKLKTVIYHNVLGSQYERMLRVQKIAGLIAQFIADKENGWFSASRTKSESMEQIGRAAYLAKADLLTDMVGEFPELQGVMGSYYAWHDEKNIDIANAIEDHYKPRFSGDTLARGDLGLILALADKLETLVGMFAIGNIPTGDKDPFALRRCALGILRMLSENQPSLPAPTIEISQLLQLSISVFDRDMPSNTENDIKSFLIERLKFFLKEKGFSVQEIEAVLDVQFENIKDVLARLNALVKFIQMPEEASLVSANKRIANILKKSEQTVFTDVNLLLLEDKAEINLNTSLDDIEISMSRNYAVGNYNDVLLTLAQLHRPVDEFFNQVMVNCDNEAVRRNRLALLQKLNAAMNKVANLSKLGA